MRSPRRTLLALTALAAALSLSACGNKTASLHGGETEGIYVNVGPMLYQVQLSRQLNPHAIPEDQTFTNAIQGGDGSLGNNEIWFAVFMRVENGTDQAHRPAAEYTITDTSGATYHPVELGASNPFHYRTRPIPAHDVAPDPDSVASQNSINGMELLFKLPRDALVNRPLILHISDGNKADESEVTLDV